MSVYFCQAARSYSTPAPPLVRTRSLVSCFMSFVSTIPPSPLLSSVTCRWRQKRVQQHSGLRAPVCLSSRSELTSRASRSSLLLSGQGCVRFRAPACSPCALGRRRDALGRRVLGLLCYATSQAVGFACACVVALAAAALCAAVCASGCRRVRAAGRCRFQ